MRIATWNVRWGGIGGVARIVDSIARHAPDLIVVTEFAATVTGERLRCGLAEIGLRHIRSSEPPTQRLGVLIAARKRLRVAPERCAPGAPHLLAVACGALTVLGVYLPCDRRKVPYWRSILRTARGSRDTRTILIGDFNTGATPADGDGTALKHAAYIHKLAKLGFVDPWRRDNPEAVEHSWMERKHGRYGKRLDHAYLSPGMAEDATAFYSHAEREADISDHSLLIVDLDAGASRARPRQMKN